jgi:hypothetical protein
MSTERKIQSARENGRKSHGAVTPEGKRNSARNATRHGLFARTLLLDRESATRFHNVVTGLHEEFQPETPAEIAAVETMAWSRWRQMRLWTLEQAAINAEIRKLNSGGNQLPADHEGCAVASRAFSALGDRSNALALFNRCENSYDRQFTRAFRRLIAIRQARSDRKQNENAKRTHHAGENKQPAPESEPNPIPIGGPFEPNRTQNEPNRTENEPSF